MAMSSTSGSTPTGSSIWLVEGCDSNGVTEVALAFSSQPSAQRFVLVMAQVQAEHGKLGAPYFDDYKLIRKYPVLVTLDPFKDWERAPWHAADALLGYDWFVQELEVYP